MGIKAKVMDQMVAKFLKDFVAQEMHWDQARKQ